MNKNKNGKEYYLHPEDGITFIEKIIPNSNNKSLKYFKLFRIGYDWDEDINDFWNGKFFSINEAKWLGAIKS